MNKRICSDIEFHTLYPTEPGTVRADGFAGHCCVSNRCSFRLHHHVLTVTGERFRISTIGLYKPDGLDNGFEPLSLEYLFETMVFKEYINSQGFLDFSADELSVERTNDSIDATIIHYATMFEWMEAYE